MILYAKFSNERDRAFAIRTVVSEENGVRTVVKSPACPEALPHVRRMGEHYETLRRAWEKAGFLPNRVRMEGDHAVFEYLAGERFENALYAFRDKPNAFCRMWKSFFDRLDETADGTFSVTDGFREVFGEISLPSGTPSASCADIDLIPANIIEHEGGFHVIDYEWTFDFPVPLSFIKWRAAVYFALKLPEESVADLGTILGLIPVSEEEHALFWSMEEHFQSYMLGKHQPLRLLYGEMSPGSVDMTHLERWTAAQETVTVYLDRGEGLSEDLVRRFPVDPDGYAQIRVKLSGLTGFRIDPTEQPALVRIGSEKFVREKGEEQDISVRRLIKTVTVNGYRIADGQYAFPEADPWIHVTQWPGETEECVLTVHVEKIPEGTAKLLLDMLNARSLKERAKQLIRGRKNGQG